MPFDQSKAKLGYSFALFKNSCFNITSLNDYKSFMPLFIDYFSDYGYVCQ